MLWGEMLGTDTNIKEKSNIPSNNQLHIFKINYCVYDLLSNILNMNFYPFSTALDLEA